MALTAWSSTRRSSNDNGGAAYAAPPCVQKEERTILDLIIRNGTVVGPSSTEKLSIAVKDGIIVGLFAPDFSAPAKKVIDAKGMLVMPGLIDSHAHITSTGGEFTSLDNYYNGTLAAAYGGTTSFIDFSFLRKGETPISALERKLAEINGNSLLDYSFHPCVNRACEQFYGEIRDLMRGGYPSIKLFTVYRDTLMMPMNGVYEVLKIIAQENGIALVHAESAELIEPNIQRCVDTGNTTPWDHAMARPPITELEAMYSVASMVADLGTPVIFAHMTTGMAEGLLSAARGRLPLYAEVCPHYLTLDQEKYRGDDGCNFVCSPPLRSEPQREALWSLVTKGLVDIVTSDHTDYSSAQKRKYKGDFTKIPNGLPTIETRALVFFSEGVAKGRISANRFVELCSTNIAKRMGLYPRKGVIRVGSDADITVIDPNVRQVWSAQMHHMQTDFSPFEGMELTGKVMHTIVRGEPIICDGRFTGTSSRGRKMERSSPILD